MNKSIIKIAAIFGGIAVIFGAFGAHYITSLIEQNKIDENRLATWQTAVQYHFYHAIALAILGLVGGQLNKKQVKRSSIFFISGILIFSGSLYLLVLSPLLFQKEFSWLGAITPLGGMCFILGWFFLFLSARKSIM